MHQSFSVSQFHSVYFSVPQKSGSSKLAAPTNSVQGIRGINLFVIEKVGGNLEDYTTREELKKKLLKISHAFGGYSGVVISVKRDRA